MGILKTIFRTQGFFMVLLGIILLFIPVVGLIAGLPVLLVGIFIFSRAAKEKKLHNDHSFLAKLLLKVKLITKLKEDLKWYISILFIAMFFSPFAMLYLYIPAIIWLFIMFNRIKHEEWLASGKQVSARWFHIGRKLARWFGAGVIAIIIGFLIVSIPIYLIAYHAPKDMSLMDYIFFRVIIGVFCIPFIFLIILGFWMIRFSYRNPYYSHFNVIEPGQIVISREGIISKHHSLNEYVKN
ncbi:hypothetical protein HYW20_08025 [Candidatus Woesearchaeota archaeon]|nr:hypothetical protein [Candidatus Woesearchaeota archaeon]